VNPFRYLILSTKSYVKSRSLQESWLHNSAETHTHMYMKKNPTYGTNLEFFLLPPARLA